MGSVERERWNYLVSETTTRQYESLPRFSFPTLTDHIVSSSHRFARIRLSLRFELLCLDPSLDASESSKGEPRCPSVGLKKIQKLSRLGAHEDQKSPSRSSSTPDIFGYFQVY